ncbi:hypothetical protein R0131_03615 [Clostridium sp. AL.422]|uniref:hypothetical protein n=1 Tax=Clostridium TaxID=1485 RepID=UPI00293DFF15|nr:MULTISPECIES: hypothetical protein [unclassified Clostridium]MDV4149915.1 hypothetical protein [Clostridium sp. AL.422]
MKRPSLKEIYGENSSYNEIKVNNLKNDIINTDHKLIIKSLLRELRVKHISALFIALIINLFTAIFVYELIKSGDNIFTKESLLVIITFILFLFPTFDISSKLYLMRNGLPKKAQYGVVKIKFYENKSTSSKSTRAYYTNVIFPMDNTIIRRVNCTKKFYNLVSEGSEVLVVSFDNKNAHIVLI